VGKIAKSERQKGFSIKARAISMENTLIEKRRHSVAGDVAVAMRVKKFFPSPMSKRVH
jgi:uncharacterized protein (DUF2062 family)